MQETRSEAAAAYRVRDPVGYRDGLRGLEGFGFRVGGLGLWLPEGWTKFRLASWTLNYVWEHKNYHKSVCKGNYGMFLITPKP